MGESSSDACKWVVEHWLEATPPGEVKGITDVAHVRAAIRRMRDTWLDDCIFVLNDGLRISELGTKVVALDPNSVGWHFLEALPAGFEKDGCAIAAIESGQRVSVRGVAWMPRMRRVLHLRTLPIVAPGD